ncbi:hypothetical protein Bbelb_077820 [Branchiostoma belcheri]|nr:hypothetical protein Bbelb_077820 [Branchiostoma belcheri]
MDGLGVFANFGSPHGGQDAKPRPLSASEAPPNEQKVALQRLHFCFLQRVGGLHKVRITKTQATARPPSLQPQLSVGTLWNTERPGSGDFPIKSFATVARIIFPRPRDFPGQLGEVSEPPTGSAFL